jgi:hypothetical protein
MSEEPEFVIYKGRRMVVYWPERIEQAQLQPTYKIAGQEYQRVPYGLERGDWGADAHPCGDCKVVMGEYHVPSCDVEQCPLCGNQALTCDCEYEDVDET